MCSPTFLLLLSSLFALVSCGDPRAVHFQTSQQDRSISSSHIHDNSRPQRYASLYKAPAPYRTLGRPLLNSFIVTSRPLDLNKNLDRKKDALENSSPSPSPAPVVEDGFRYIPQFKIECNARQGPCSETITSPSSPTTPPTFKQHSQESITRFVQTLRDDGGNGIRRNGEDSSEEFSAPEGELGPEDGEQHSTKHSKANLWYRPSPHRPPQNDKKGWVALDPVPWSSSKISKWTPDKNNPGSKPPEATRAPFPQRPQLPTQTSYNRPTTFQQTGQENLHWYSSPKPPRPHDSYQTASSASSPMIITDGKDPEWPLTHSGPQRPIYNRPSNDRPQAYFQVRPENNFPNYYPDHRPSISHRPHGWGISSQHQDGTSRRPQNYPTPVVYHDEPSSSSQGPHSVIGDGQWVVLSDTKEYKPKTADRRSYGRFVQNEDISPKSNRVRTSRRMVKLTVLPSEGNSTTSHGGMLEVDGSFDTVDEDRRKRMLLQNAGVHGDMNNNKASPIVVHTLTSNQGQVTRVDRAKAVMAAVGAGMVPATVAAILPMVLAQRARRSVGLSSQQAEEIARIIERFPIK